MRVAAILKTISADIAHHSQNELFDLSHLSALQVIGARGSEFLQGQITCDLREVNAVKMQAAAFCGVNGRILALMDVIDWHGLYLILPDDLCAPIQSSMSKAALFSQVQIVKSDKWRAFGLKLNLLGSKSPLDTPFPLEKNGMISGKEYCCYHLYDDFYMILINTDAVELILELFSQASWSMCSALSWHDLQIQARRAKIYPESRGMFFPHRIGLQHTDHISFNKGCYRGQEIIARMHYRAQLKHELRVITIEFTGEIIIGQALTRPVTHEKIGLVIDYCRFDQNKCRLLISLQINYTGEISLGLAG